MKRFALLMAAMLLMLAGCNPSEPETVDVDSVSVSPSSLDLKVGESATLTATVKPDNATDKTVSWQSTAPAVAKVEKGVVTALSLGTAYIHATAGGETGVCTVTVSAAAVPVESISLDCTEKELTVGESFTLNATVLPADASDKTVSWSTSDAAVATVANGTVTAVSPGTATITATANGKTASCAVTVKAAGPQIVDLGLSVLWADRNVGAEKPEEYGDYYAWGETETKDTYSFSNCKWFGYGTENLTKYITHEKNGVVDNNLHMDPEDDVASIKLGDKWRTPTEAEFKELLDRCNWEWIGDAENKGGYKVTGPNGNSIYLPSAGGKGLTDPGYTGFYWASDIVVSIPNNSTQIIIDPGSARLTTLVRFFGCSVRPVYGDIVRVGGVSFDSDSETLNQGETLQLSATIAPQNAFEKGILWTSSDESVATVGNNYDNYGLVTAVGEGTATITATTVDGGFKATCTVTVIKSFEFAAVDLGLSVKWANANLGAAGEAQIGWGYAWGEVPSSLTGKDKYDWNTYKWCNGSYNSLTKYNNNGSYGAVDNLMQLAIEDDIAHSYLGGNWRMPTLEEMKELMERCTWTPKFSSYTSYYIVTGPNGNSILMNLTGYMQGNKLLSLDERGAYWTSTLNPYDPSTAKVLSFNTSNIYIDSEQRRWGLNVRPVLAE